MYMAFRLSTACVVVSAALAAACGGTGPVATPAAPEAGGVAVAAAGPSPTAGPALATATPETAASPISVDLGSGSLAHDFELTLLDGKSLRLSDLRGKVVVLNFWASWCVPCRWEMPSFERIWQEYRDQDVVFVGVAVSDEEEDVRAFAEKVGVSYPLGLDTSGKITVAYRATTLPTTVLIDRRGYESRKIANAANEAALRIFLKGLLE